MGYGIGGLERDDAKVVIITNKRHKFYGCRAVTPKMYMVRILDKTKPLLDRLHYDKNGKVSSTSSKQYSMYVTKKSVKMTNETAKTKTNTWHKKTGELLRK